MSLINAFVLLWQENTLVDWIVAVAILTALAIFILFFKNSVHSKLVFLAKRTTSRFDDILVDALNATSVLLLLVGGSCVAFRSLRLSDSVDQSLLKVLIIVCVLQLGLWGQRAIKKWALIKIEYAKENHEIHLTTHVGLVAITVTFFLWVTLLILGLSNLGFNVTALLASLGIGGVAMALALQNILGDVFASMSISIDKPFLVGDFIVVDNLLGTVKQVGLKTTRLQSVTGEELIISNSDLLRSRIRNYKRMTERRALFTFGIRKDTSIDLIEKIGNIAREVVESREHTRFEWAHFRSINIHSLDIEVSYFMTMPNHSVYLETQHTINIDIIRRLNGSGIRLSLPTDRAGE